MNLIFKIRVKFRTIFVSLKDGGILTANLELSKNKSFGVQCSKEAFKLDVPFACGNS